MAKIHRGVDFSAYSLSSTLVEMIRATKLKPVRENALVPEECIALGGNKDDLASCVWLTIPHQRGGVVK